MRHAEQALNNLVATAWIAVVQVRVERIEPDIEAGTHVAHEYVGENTAECHEATADEDPRDTARSNVNHDHEQAEEHECATEVGLQDHDAHRDAPRNQHRRHVTETRQLERTELPACQQDQVAF